MSEIKTYPVPAGFAAQANINDDQYQAMYQQSTSDPEGFWGEQAEKYITWFKKWDKVIDWSFGKDDLHIEWFKGATLNVSYNCLDRHLDSRGDQVAIIWEGDNPEEDRKITYRELHQEVCKFANVLKSRGVKKGDRVSLYLPMIPEAAVAMLACTRIGAVHSIVFGGFSPDALRDRILDSDCQVVITADQSMRGGKRVPLKANADKAIAQCPNVHTCIVVKRGGDPVDWSDDRDVWYHEAMSGASNDCAAEEMQADDPLFILYTSGSTGKPKGVLHTTGGYLLQAAMTHKLVFDYKDGEVYWCTADVGWVTGHTYIVYGPLTNGAISVMFEGIPTYPDISRFWQVCDKHNVATFYTAPTAIRSLMGAGEEPVKKTSRSSLRLLGTVGEPINPEAWEWYYRVVGDERCPIVDTWWQTETGAHMLTPLPGATPLKPGSATRPFFGVEPVLLDDQGNEIDGNPAEGNLAIKRPWPSMMRTVYGDHKRFFETYFAMYPGYYFTGDGARRDEDGYYWITGRVDDVLNVSGHRLGTAEIESALVLHDLVAEAAVVGYPHELTGQGIYAYVTLMAGTEGSDELKTDLVKLVRSEIGPIAKVNLIQWAPGLPKTRSGKIMRRILRKIAANELENLGDTSTLADPTVVDNLIDNRENK
ncbi:MAG: acetate--CoA ligase [gamma proteobacterium symbiont of Ctena orbiculata]|uniref:Acetyl-coenzyme A synthetase n=1 Tax=Candidatus Thiodiazotropha taylori TaxID=2792791 RepID=A0A944MGD9_9GAMM|nr:acetate--CoA ligase [Candidatus Thiodiazotropha taylori]MBV2138971.1 acetate--CoA ligase [Candidatus Thiodiazotropha taylori]PVV10118.1 MAG: acetate--CoA ligase [gamma proteobacterium symbiont of Ctena orbiculata]PVV21708.1 MAG: acetate--CoA ligase [gamma proteobacterium symbiont of Ctena orbiculata]